MDSKVKYVKNLITRILLTIILGLGSIIFINSSDKNFLLYKNNVYVKSIKFNKVNKFIKNIFGEKDILKKIANSNDIAVFNDKLIFSNSVKQNDGVLLTVTESYLIPSLESGIVVFIGEKENIGNTVIIQGTNGIDYWYGNVTNLNIKIYDYVEAQTLIGETQSNKLYLAFQKEGTFLNYEDYI